MANQHVLSEIPGNVWKIEVAVGDQVEDGMTVVILESMKMEVPIQSTLAGTVSEILVKEGDFVGEGQAVVALTA